MRMNNAEASLSWAEALACFYLIIPAFLFFALFATAPFAIAACCFIAWSAWDIWRRVSVGGQTFPWWSNAALLLLAIGWVCLGGVFGHFSLNSDWPKHFGVFNFLAEPGRNSLTTGAGEMMRYYLAWYIVPAMAMKISGLHEAAAFAGLWTAAGVFLFFRLMLENLGTFRQASIAMAVFALFSGADILGTLLTGYQVGPKYHFEWWAGWLSYDASTTLLFWVPQHAIPAWLMTALLARQIERTALLPHLALLFAATQLWSPFVALGLVPFAAYLLFRQHGRQMLFDWKPLCAVAIVGIPIALYITTAAGKVPAMPAWEYTCPYGGPCYSIAAYLRFALVEFLAVAILLAAWKPSRTPLMFIATATLLLTPFFRIGEANDLGMRSSIPALAVLAMMAGRQVANAPWKIVTPMVAVLFIGAATPLAEIWRGATQIEHFAPDQKLEDALAPRPEFRQQYFAPALPWLIR